MHKKRKVFVSGCFDLLHSGHVAFLQEAASYGDVYVGLGSDGTVFGLKGLYPVNNQDERKYMLEALACVHTVVVNSGSGIMDFAEEIDRLKPDIFIVNEDGNSPAKENLCRELHIEYLVLKLSHTLICRPGQQLLFALHVPCPSGSILPVGGSTSRTSEK